jgi:hypothetical protein
MPYNNSKPARRRYNAKKAFHERSVRESNNRFSNQEGPEHGFFSRRHRFNKK